MQSGNQISPLIILGHTNSWSLKSLVCNSSLILFFLYMQVSVPTWIMYAMFTKPTGVCIIPAGLSVTVFLSGEKCNSKASRTRIGIDERRIGKLIVKQTREQQDTQVQLDYSSSMACWPPYWLDGSISGTVNKYSRHHSNGQHSNEERRSGEMHWLTSRQLQAYVKVFFI